MTDYSFLVDSFTAGIFASLACGVGALPLVFADLDVDRLMTDSPRDALTPPP